MTPYRGYTAVFWYEPDDRLFHGHLAGIRDVIHFAGRSVDELERAFREGVDDYLAWAEEDDFEPQRPDGRHPPTDPDRLIQEAAAADGQPVEEWTRETLRRAARERLAS